MGHCMSADLADAEEGQEVSVVTARVSVWNHSLKFNVNEVGIRIFLAEGQKRVSKTGRKAAFVPLGHVAKKTKQSRNHSRPECELTYALRRRCCSSISPSLCGEVTTFVGTEENRPLRSDKFKLRHPEVSPSPQSLLILRHPKHLPSFQVD